MQATFIVVILLLFPASASLAVSYNLRCVTEDGFSTTILTVRDSWNPFSAPTIRAVQGRPGETALAEVERYTSDQIRVLIPVEIEGVSGKSIEAITIDRNTGVAQFELKGPQHHNEVTGVRWQLNVAKFNGHCERQEPRF